MAALKVITYNVRGINSPIKRKKIIGQLKKESCHIAYLQETHLSDIEHDKLKASWVHHVYYSSHQSGRKRGVAILIHKQVNFTLNSTFKDSSGRYILVNGSIDGMEVSLLNVYAPNNSEPNFMRNIFSNVLRQSTGVLLLGGDFNCVMSPHMDRQPSSNGQLSPMNRTLKHFIAELELIDVWRSRFPHQKDFTFYSQRHSSYSRIDLFFTTKAEEHRIEDIKILPITISDHAPLTLSWNLGQTKNIKYWRLNASLLNDKEFREFIHAELEEYLCLNATPGMSPLILWDCAKAFLRGRIISFACAKRKKKEARQKEILDKITILEQQHKKKPTSKLLNELNQLRGELDTLLTGKIEASLRFLKQKFYENGNKASRLLAIRLKKQQSANTIQKIRSGKDMITKPAKIAECFVNYYKALYENTDTCKDSHSITDFLKNINLKTMPEDLAKQLDEPIRIQEITETISQLKPNKSPGPDGFINEFYRIFIDKISPLLLKAYHHALQTEKMAPSWNDATIVVIHKEGKDPTNCQSYRPISLLNADLRILTTILARRLSKIVTNIINPDQTGFMTGRHYSDNVRRLVNLISFSKSFKQEAMILSLDAQKAFDRVSWQYLFHTLTRFQFGPNFIKWTKILYSNPLAAVRVNGTISGRFSLERGCRQGCSLSPLLFNISLEPLAQLIRDDEDIKGVTIMGEQHKLSIYADDVLLYLSDISTTIPHLKQLILKYGFLSGYKVNMDKTLAMDICDNIPQIVKDTSGFKWPKDGIKYLGIQIPPNLANLYNVNYKVTIEKIRKDLERWTVLPLSIMGRIESIRMNILPKLLYLFQMLPINISNSTFKDLDKLFSQFIWQGKRSRIKFNILKLPKSQGGLNIPNLRYYFWAAQLRPMVVWMQDQSNTQWLNIEKSLCDKPLGALPFSGFALKDVEIGEWSSATIKIWKKIQQCLDLPKDLSALSSIACLQGFTPSLLNSGFSRWSNFGITKLFHLLGKGQLKSFEQLNQEFHLPHSESFRYLQIKSFISKHKDFKKVIKPSPFEELLIKIHKGYKLSKSISQFYKILSSTDINNTLHIKTKWGDETHSSISDEMWEDICSEAHLVTCSNLWREFKWKTITRFFRTPAITAKYKPGNTDTCWRYCGTDIGHHTHIFWTCPIIETFWNDIFTAIGDVFNRPFAKDVSFAILGAIPDGFQGKDNKYLLRILLTAALKCITIKWLKADPPTFSMWIDKVKEIHKMEEITYSLRLKKEMFIKRWSPAGALLC